MSEELKELTKQEATGADISEVDHTSKGTRRRHSSGPTHHKSKQLSGSSQLREETGPGSMDEHMDSSARIGRKKSRRKQSPERESPAVSTHSAEGVHESTPTRSKKKKHSKPVERESKEPEDKIDIGAPAPVLAESTTKQPSAILAASALHTETPKPNEVNADTAPTAVPDADRPNPEPSVSAATRSTAQDDSVAGPSSNVTAPREAVNTDGEKERAAPKGVQAGKRSRRDSIVEGLAKVNMVIGLIAGGMLLLMLTVSLAWTRSQTYTICSSSGCALYSRMFDASLNESAANPCDNFTAFVCDGWTRHNKYSVRENLIVNALGSLSILSQAVQTTAEIKTPAERAMAFFRSCDAVLRGEMDELLTVKRLLAAANITWPRWSKAPDVLKTLLYSSVKLRWSPLFNIEIDTTVTYGTEVFLMPFEDFRLLRRKFYSLQGATESDRRAYFYLLRDTFGSTPAAEGDTTYEEVASVCESMLVPLFEALQEQSTTEAINTSVLHQAKLTRSRWESALALYGVTERPITYSTEALPYIEKFFELWNTYGENKTHLLVSWCTIQVAALYANQKLIANYYGSADKALVEHGASCLGKAYLMGKFALFADYNSHMVSKDGREDLENMAHNVRQAFHSRLQRWKHYEPVRTVVRDWDSAATVFSAFDIGEGNVENITQFYFEFGDSLPDNWRKAAISMKTMRSDKVFMAMESLGLHAVLYDDFILLPFSASFPLYYANAIPAVKYGGIGKEMAMSLSGLFYDTYWRFEQANNSIMSVSKCIGGPEALANNLEAIAMNALYDAYMNASAGRDVRLVGLEKYTASKIFFIASCYAKCSGSMGSNYGDCNEALRQVESFALTFECPYKAYMNPEKPCHLF